MPDPTEQIDASSSSRMQASPVATAAPAPAEPAGKRVPSELALIISFLIIITVVPVVQTCLELARHERVQFTDVLRYRPTSKNLRQFEATLKEKSWFQQKLRPAVQRLLFATLHDTGAKGMLGRDQWLFYRPDVRYLVEPDRRETAPGDDKWAQPAAPVTLRQSVARAITRFRDQLKERGITLVVVPVPGKPSIYPDQLTRREHDAKRPLSSPTSDLIKTLEQEGVITVDLFSGFGEARRNGGPQLYLARDTHWTPAGAGLAAKAVAARLRGAGLAPAQRIEFQSRRIPVTRWGDILEMMQIPGLRQALPRETVECEQVFDPTLGLLMPTASDRPGVYRYPGQKTSILVLGDSFCRIYQYPEPQSLGELRQGQTSSIPGPASTQATKRPFPGSAGFISQLAFTLNAPVDAIYSDGGASTDVRRKLSTNPEILEGKKVVVWEFVERDIALGQSGWEDVPLPPKLD
jgi:hypothetical protein